MTAASTGTMSAPHLAHAQHTAGRFRSVLCGVDRSIGGRAAHEHAIALAAPGGAVEVVRAPELTRHGRRALHDACEGHDLLVLGAGRDALAVIDHAPIPVLVGRWSPLGTELTDTILVPIDDSPESSRAVEFAGPLAAAHDGTVIVLVAPARDAALERAIAASRRILLRVTGATPRVLGRQVPRERSIPAAALEVDASLVVLATDDNENARRRAHIAARVECSVLSIPRRSDPNGSSVGTTVPVENDEPARAARLLAHDRDDECGAASFPASDPASWWSWR